MSAPPRGPRWTSELVVDGQLAFRIGREGDTLVAEWLDLCELRSDRSGMETSFVARDGADARLVAKVKAGLGDALVRHLRGGTSLHASSVIGRERGGYDRALAFLGRSGAGKSTLAAWLCRSRGLALVADDVVRLERDPSGRVVVVPTEAEHWLEPASLRALELRAGGAEGKTPIAASLAADRAAPLAAMLSLSLEEHGPVVPELSRIRGHRALAALVPCLVRFVLDEPEAQKAELERLSTLLASVPLYELRARRRFDALPAIADALEELR